MTANDTSPESDIQLKKRARRRLVGASALALLAVIVLPMVMDREPRPALQDIQVRIPAQDSAGLAAKIPGKPAPTPLPPVEPSTEPAAEAKAEVKAEPVAPKADTKPAATPAPAHVAVPAAPAPAPVAAAVPAAKPASEKPVADKPAVAPADKKAEAKAADAAKAKAAVEGAAPGGQWVVQLGAYKDAANVKLLLAKLKGMGVPAYTEHFDSPQGPRTRVRAGPFPSREAAEKARVAKIKKVGVDGPVAPK